MVEHKKRFRIEFTVDVHHEGVTKDWDYSNDDIKHFALQELECMSPYPFDITFSEVDNPWHTGTPTEEGWYLIEMKDWEKQRVYYVPDYVSVHDLVLPTVQSFYELHLWQKIEPSDEANDFEHKITPLKANKEKEDG